MSEWNVGAPPFRWGFCLVSWKGRTNITDTKNHRANRKKRKNFLESSSERRKKLLPGNFVSRPVCSREIAEWNKQWKSRSILGRQGTPLPTCRTTNPLKEIAHASTSSSKNSARRRWTQSRSSRSASSAPIKTFGRARTASRQCSWGYSSRLSSRLRSSRPASQFRISTSSPRLVQTAATG